MLYYHRVHYTNTEKVVLNVMGSDLPKTRRIARDPQVAVWTL